MEMLINREEKIVERSDNGIGDILFSKRTSTSSA